MKTLKITLWALSFLILFAGIILIIVEAAMGDSKMPGIITAICSSITFLLAFMVDAINVMVFSTTKGDVYTTMSTEKLCRVLEARKINYEEGRERAYYLTMCRNTHELEGKENE